ncbi:MAG: SDR family oxidoreductase [Candidatus Helarchaeota archaeon]|nr:SDR family oxidoreductase [Candidatus Helarchaeota archaeon]
MNGKIVMITGANSGIGKATTLGLAEMGATIVMVCRNRERGEDAFLEIKEKTGNPKIDLLIADLSSQQEIRNLVKEFKSKYQQLDILINNAAVVLSKRQTTVDGLETVFATNHLAPFLLTNLLLDVLKASAPARIINITSGLHSRAKMDFDDLQSEKKFGAFWTYNKSKLALMLFTYELARRLEGSGVTVNVVHPGVARTNLGRDMNWFSRGFTKIFFKSPKKCAETPIYVASSPDLEGVNGKYLANKKEKQSSKESYNEADAKRLWEISAELTGLSTKNE